MWTATQLCAAEMRAAPTPRTTTTVITAGAVFLLVSSLRGRRGAPRAGPRAAHVKSKGWEILVRHGVTLSCRTYKMRNRTGYEKCSRGFAGDSVAFATLQISMFTLYMNTS